MTNKLSLARGAAALLAMGGITAADAGTAVTQRVDLRHHPAVRIVGAAAIAPAGDVNGDGIPDVLVSRGHIVKRPNRGRSWVVFGSRAMPDRIRLGDLGDRGFVIEGADENDYASRIAGGGDINGDGLADVVVGASGVDNNERNSSGTVYVVFGKKDSDPVSLEDFDSGTQGDLGFRIDGPAARSLAGEDVAILGDLNGDGMDDILVGAPFGGATYVVLGKEDTLPIDLLTHDFGGPFTGGFRIDTPSPDHSDGYSVAGAGDVNGDGTLDVVVGVFATTGARGSAFVVFGRTDVRRVDVRERGDWGFRVRGRFGGSATGYVTGSAGDVNGDRLDDVIVGAPTYFPLEGETFVVYGKPDNRPIDLRHLGSRGYVINGARPADSSGIAVDGGEDVNGDRIPDLLTGADLADYRKRAESGEAYVVFGRRRGADVELRRLGRRGVVIGGARGAPDKCRRDFSSCPGDRLGEFVAFLGDIDGDGLSEVGAAAPWAGRPRQQGIAYVLWSSDLSPTDEQ